MEMVNKMYTTAEIDRKSFNDEDRSFVAWASKPVLDRDNELIQADAWDTKNYEMNNVICWAHDYSKPPVGKALWTKAQKQGLQFKPSFAETDMGKELYQLYKDGVLHAFSVGFVPKEGGYIEGTKASEPKRTYTDVELLEISCVTIPSCPEALVAAYDSGEIKTKGLQDAVEFAIGKDAEPVTKPETTENYHRIPVNQCKITATITISAAKGIKALYCGKEKKVATYLFDKTKWTMAEAKKWVEEHKDDKATDVILLKEGRVISAKNRKMLTATRDATSTATDALNTLLDETEIVTESEPKSTPSATTKADGMWNKTLPKSFDIAAYDEANTVFRYSLFTKFLECQVKEIYVNSYHIPSPLVGTYLKAINTVTTGMTIDDTRRFSYEGKESPPSRSYIQLNSKRRERFLVDGSEYCHEDDIPLVKDFSPSWGGMHFSIITSNDHETRNDEIMNEIHAEADSNHMLRGEKFALSGEFLSDTDDSWDGLIINAKDKQAIQKSLLITNTNGNSRGLLFVGPPGTGKTKAGRTIMNDTDTTFIWMSARDFMYGMPSSILALAFDMSRKLSPTVLFMEDVDKDLDKDMLKTELDGLKQNKGLMTILTTNHPDKLPKALIDRPGRFHHVILFDLPDAKQRKEMFELWAGDISIKVLDKLVEATEGFSGAHINHLVEYAQTIAEDEELTTGAALVESLIRMSDQIELVAGLRGTGMKRLFNVEDLIAEPEEPVTFQEILQVHAELKAEKEQSEEVDALEMLVLELRAQKGEFPV